MKLLTLISRLLVGSLFIVSGLIKANDTLGFSYKLHDYFAEEVLNLPFLDPFAWHLSVVICVVEIVLGIALILGYKSKLTAWSLLGMIVFFTFLTFYSAYFNKVTDCGCFGDALHLTPWQSFSKDVVLLFFILIIFWKKKEIKPGTFSQDMVYMGISIGLIFLFSVGVIGWAFPVIFALVSYAVLLIVKTVFDSEQMGWILATIATAISFGFSYYTYAHLPIEDFRPYAIGKNIEEGMTMPEGAVPPEYMYMYTMKNAKTGETFETSSIDYLEKEIWKNEDLEIDETSEPILYKDGYTPPVHDFSLISMDTDEDLTDTILHMDAVFLLVAYDIEQSNGEIQPTVNSFQQSAEKGGIPFYGVTAGLYDQVETFRHEHQSMFPYLSCDAITLKTIIRSNPGLVLLKNGTVIGKWHYNDFPTFEEVKSELL
ncbi:MAG: DoxX family protein [Crocinitomicaceae bacterium]|nr:DoxX family protein [Crocinitomicaceae bacterium]|tara:strand:+ start:5802 stop:7085 length:1284 start_codon:yes stop_codon:yes gene_type:complete